MELAIFILAGAIFFLGCIIFFTHKNTKKMGILKKKAQTYDIDGSGRVNTGDLVALITFIREL